MRLMTTWSLGLVLTLAALAQAQSETPNSRIALGALAQAQAQGKTPNNAPAPTPDVANQNYFLATFYPDFNVAYQVNPYEGSGLSLAAVDDAARIHLKLPKGQGLIVTSIVPQRPAAQAGVSQNDILLTLDDAPLAKPEDLEERLKAAGDKTLNLALLRHGQKKTLRIQPRVMVTFGPVQPAPPEFWIGISVTPVEPALRDQLQLPANQGLMATSIIDNSPAAKAGFKVNDILLSINGKLLTDQAKLVDLVQKNGEKPVSVETIREGARQMIGLTPERRKGPHLLAARVQHAGNWNVIRPGAVLQGNEAGFVATPDVNYWFVPEGKFEDDLVLQGVRSFNINPLQSQANSNPPADRLDTMAAEIKELRKAVEELSKAIKDRK